MIKLNSLIGCKVCADVFFIKKLGEVAKKYLSGFNINDEVLLLNVDNSGVVLKHDGRVYSLSHSFGDDIYIGLAQ